MAVDGPVYVGAYWGSRREDLEKCASRLQICLAALAQVSPIFGRWKPKGGTGMEALSGDEVVASQLVDALGRGVNRRDADGSVIEELGWSWSAWNGMSRSPAAVSLLCGATTGSVGVLNSIVLQLPDPSDEGARGLYERQAAIDVLLAISGAWEPDFAVVTSNELRELLDRNSDRPVVGWVNYLASARPVPQVIAGVDLLLTTAGTVLALQKPWATVGPKDVEALAGVLDRSGALSPIA
jgi:hypothetical protein